eukprot:TRINITY_DN5150_c0_g1_i1.p1 TRINITY_DN5150_c0_g1~~TRINITY_DN5150_c0_g1_i1.p1  ORF type:complete len:150 (+),score=33.30 TRINITY_DN5150_c0_g1_i1:26-451(+)
MFQKVKQGVRQFFDLSGGVVEEEGFLEFRTVPLNSWVPSFLTATILTILAVFIIMREPANWFVSVVLWVFGGLFLFRTKQVVYSLDKEEGTLTVRTTTITGVTTSNHWLAEIYDVRFLLSKDTQGGSDADVYLFFHKREED